MPTSSKRLRSRKRDGQNAEILDGHLSSALCHLGNISDRLGRPPPFNTKTKSYGDDKQAYETLARMEEHLKDNMVPLDKTAYRLGTKLVIDPTTETFTNDSEANLLLTREYRKGF